MEYAGVISSIARPLGQSFKGRSGGKYKRLKAVLGVRQAVGIEAVLSPDPLLVVWSKFVVWCSLAGITSAGRTRIERFIGYPADRLLFA